MMKLSRVVSLFAAFCIVIAMGTPAIADVEYDTAPVYYNRSSFSSQRSATLYASSAQVRDWYCAPQIGLYTRVEMSNTQKTSYKLNAIKIYNNNSFTILVESASLWAGSGSMGASPMSINPYQWKTIQGGNVSWGTKTHKYQSGLFSNGYYSYTQVNVRRNGDLSNACTHTHHVDWYSQAG